MRRGKDSYQSFTDTKRDGDFGKRIVFAGNVVLVFANVGRIVRLASGGDVPDHSFHTDFQPMTLAMYAATPHSGKHHLAVFLVMQVNACFQAAKRLSDFIDDIIDELVKIKDRRDALRGFLHALQVFDDIGGQTSDGKNSGHSGTGEGGHRNQFLLVQEPWYS